MSAWMRFVKAAVDLVYPRNCRHCCQPLAERELGVLCPRCLATAKPIEPPFCQRCALPFNGKLDEDFDCGYCKELKFHFSRAVAACRAEGIVLESIHRYKYNRELYYEHHLAEWLGGAAKRWIDWCQVDALVPIPLFPRKQRAREFNQAELLAKALARQFGVPVLGRCVRRVKETTTQTALDAASRRANLRGAFAVRRAGLIRERRVVLVDDVFTTGATLDSCARVLRENGAADVIALTVARGV